MIPCMCGTVLLKQFCSTFFSGIINKNYRVPLGLPLHLPATRAWRTLDLHASFQGIPTAWSLPEALSDLSAAFNTHIREDSVTL